MLEIMYQLAVQHLYEELHGTGDPEAWYRDMHAHRLDRLLPYLTEEARESMAGNYYVLSRPRRSRRGHPGEPRFCPRTGRAPLAVRQAVRVAVRRGWPGAEAHRGEQGSRSVAEDPEDDARRVPEARRERRPMGFLFRRLPCGLPADAFAGARSAD